jgi:hypothetical protein
MNSSSSSSLSSTASSKVSNTNSNNKENDIITLTEKNKTEFRIVILLFEVVFFPPHNEATMLGYFVRLVDLQSEC